MDSFSADFRVSGAPSGYEAASFLRSAATAGEPAGGQLAAVPEVCKGFSQWKYIGTM
jgi:hypothetical protein